MKKFFSILGKNFKILFRKKTSLFTLIFGPLIVIMILAIAFGSTSNITMTLGYISPDNSKLTGEFVTTLNEDYLTKEYAFKEDCIKELEQGLLHACIIFPENLNIENNKTNNIVFVVDNSRISLVYSVLESVSEHIDLKTEEVSKTLTDKLLDTLTYTNENIDKSVALIIKIKANIETEKENTVSIEESLSSIDVENADVDFKDILDDAENLNSNIDSTLSSIASDIDIAKDDASAAGATDVATSLGELYDYVGNAIDDNELDFGAFIEVMETAEEKISAMEDELDDIETTTSDQAANVASLREKLNTMITDLDSLKLTLEDMQTKIKTIEVTSTENIVNPITTTVETISSEENKLGMIFPYALMLIIMFVSLLLASTLVVVEKQSNAAFRTFTTPTRDEYFIFTTYITALIIIFAQIALILGVASYYDTTIILSNIYVNLVLILLGISLFIMMGMAIGYVLKSQQATNMLTITLSTIFLFLSNIVFPLETISPTLSEVVKYNPFVITSEALRKSILFGITFENILMELSLLLGYSILLFILIIIFQKMSKMTYLKKVPKFRSKINKMSVEDIIIMDDKITNKEELIIKLNNMTDDDYADFVKDNYKQFYEFLTTNVHKKIKDIKKLKKDKLLEHIAKLDEKEKKKQDKIDKKKSKKQKEVDNKHILFSDDKESEIEKESDKDIKDNK